MFVFSSCYYGDQLKEDEMGSSYNTYRRDEKWTQEIVEKSERKREYRRLWEDGFIDLKWIWSEDMDWIQPA
jgi:hypothetical protein